MPLTGRLVILKEATEPSMSEPDSDTAMVVSSLPLPEPAAVSGASLTGLMVMLAVSVAAEKAVVPPFGAVSTLVPAVPLD